MYYIWRNWRLLAIIIRNSSFQDRATLLLQIKMIIPSGIPSIREYKRLITSNLFEEIETFSNQYLANNKDILDKYGRKWVTDPFHQWSRQWEYPFVYQSIKNSHKAETKVKILDAGSGVTFFPYLLSDQLSNAEIYCCDYDVSLKKTFDSLNSRIGAKVDFSSSNLNALPYSDQSFDCIYCVSVLEHTENYEQIIREFYRVLKPGGQLVLTIDISIDGTRDISIARAGKLLDNLTSEFEDQRNLIEDLNAQVSSEGIFTTAEAKTIDPKLLPWTLPKFVYQIKSLVTSGRLGNWPPNLTVYCTSLNKSK